MHAMLPHLTPSDFPPVTRRSVSTLQVNLGYRCNQSCLHCHVNAGPTRKEQMDRDTIEQVLEVLEQQPLQKLDLTGGAPELNPLFRELVERSRALGVDVIDRCNLTILSEPLQEDLGAFLARQQVEIVASLPCYLQENVDNQRGKGVYERSIAGLKALNQLGYGIQGSGLTLNLVYNPVGMHLPPSQDSLQSDYKRQLKERHGIRFNALLTLTNMPIARFGSTLVSKGELGNYMGLLKQALHPDNLDTVMCRDLISVDYQGFLYDCDFNQMLGLELNHSGKKMHLQDLLQTNLNTAPVAVADHCYGCTAGQGSSCGGALT
ncbi:MAG TPA: radical SAM/Cys-rich domain protein [Gammaproteobacteria bacterium]|nr:radical SAM/Cys-rich domain protein [Gammaproteobacteria bacterium]